MECKFISIEKALEDLYVIPAYQRGFVWQDKQISMFLDDIIEAQTTSPDDEEHYFIGSMVVTSETDKRILLFQVIDGQQRLTTLFLILCAIRSHAKRLEFRLSTLDDKIETTKPDAVGIEHSKPRVDFKYQGTTNIIEQIREGKQIKTTRGEPKSIKNVKNAWKLILQRLQELSESELRQLYGHLIYHVWVVRIETRKIAKALSVFETINHKGLGLDSFDLTKNLLFMELGNMGEKQEEKLTNTWASMKANIDETNDRPMRFLRYFILATHGDLKNEREGYDYLRKLMQKGPKRNGISPKSDPMGYAEAMRTASAHYRNLIVHDCFRDNEKNHYIENLKESTRSSTRIYIPVLLAAKHLSSEVFNRVARNLEVCLFLAYATATRSQVLEPIIANFCKSVRDTKTEEDLEPVLETLAKEFEPIRSEFINRFDNFGDYDNMPRDRLRFMLAKLTQEIQHRSQHSMADADVLIEPYLSKNNEIEHIYPRKPNQKRVQEFGDISDETEFDVLVNKLGNLALLEKHLNLHGSNAPFSEKKEVYQKSGYLLVQQLATPPSTKKEKEACSQLNNWHIWNEDAINDRHACLKKIAEDIWSLPKK